MYFKELIQSKAEDANYEFNYGADHWQNLLDKVDDLELPFAERQKLVLLLWQDEQYLLNDYGAKIGSEFEGEFMFVVRSRIGDESYDTKYEDAIKHLKDLASSFFDVLTDCTGFDVTFWKEIEVENQYDTNFDGLKIRIKIKTNATAN